MKTGFRYISSMGATTVLLGAVLILSGSLYAVDTVKLRDFGAIPDDGADDTAAIERAFRYCVGKGPLQLVFEAGKYDISAPSDASHRILRLADVKSLTLVGNGAELSVHTWTHALIVDNCSGVEIRDLRINWAILPFFHARVKSADSGSTLLDIAGGRPPNSHINTITSLYQYDEANDRLEAGGIDWYAPSPSRPVSLETISSTAARLPLTFKSLQPGASLVVRYRTHGVNAFTVNSSQNVKFSGVTVNSAPGDAAVFTDCDNISIDQFTVDIVKGSGHWISTNADALHFTQCRGNIDITNCTLRKMGDDAINIGNIMMLNRAGSGERETVLLHCGDNKLTLPPVHAGDILAFADPSSPYVPVFKAKVTKSPGLQMRKEITVSVDRDIPDALKNNAVINNESAQSTVKITGCKIANNRARGFWLQTSNVTVQDCTVEGTSGPAVEIRSDVKQWGEGPGGSHINFINCRFADCNFGAARSKAMIYSYALDRNNSTVKSPVIDDVTFTGCTFVTKGPSMAFESTGSVSIKKCAFSSTAYSPFTGTELLKLTLENNQINGETVSPEFSIIKK
jgi:hypothetical protein